MTTTTPPAVNFAAAQAKRTEIIARHTGAHKPQATELRFDHLTESWTFHVEHAQGTWDLVRIPLDRRPLWIGPNGEVTCPAHDRTLSASHRARPAATVLDTALGSFERVTADTVRAWPATHVGPLTCEACGVQPRALPAAALAEV